jgi:hypothetical protein
MPLLGYFQSGDAMPQTRSGRTLHGKKVHQLAPKGKRSSFPAGAGFGFQLGKMMFRNQFKHLLKYCVAMGHGQESHVCSIGYSKPILTDSEEFWGLL